MSKPKPAPLPAGTVVGGYQIIKRLAAGGFGVVYLAEDPDRHMVAIKEYLPSSLAERAPGELTPRVKPDKLPLYRLGLKSFFEEGRSLAQISHPSVVSVLNFLRENETVYMVMNYLQGDTLQDFIVTARDLKRDKVFRESTIRSLFDEILRGLRIVHQHKMLHLDIKPANIFISNDNKAVLLDFGAAREVLSKEGNFIRPMYTPGFAAPEMYRRDGTLGPWTDIYAIGACIYACMQGYPPTSTPGKPADLVAFLGGFDFDRDAPRIYATDATFTESAMQFMAPPDVDDPKLESLRAHGGKLIVYHGNSDPVFSANDTRRWFARLETNLGAGASGFARLYPVPGMAHCSGGPATDQFDALGALVAWVEQGQAPGALDARVNPDNKELPAGWSRTRSRPLCPWPQIARRTGDDLESAASFRCSAP